MSERPDDTVKNCVKMWLVQRVQKTKVELNQGLEEGEEIGSDLWEGVEVCGDERQTAGEDHFKQIGQEVRVNDNTEFF